MSKVTQLAQINDLRPDIKDYFESQLLEFKHRTYLWVYLLFDYIQGRNIRYTKKGIDRVIKNLPKTVTEAYEKILSKSINGAFVLQVLSIILVAYRPLGLTELKIVTNIEYRMPLGDAS